MRKPKADYSIQTVANALRVLEEFRDEVEIGVDELSRRLGLHKNNVFRLLATLEEKGYIEQDAETERYRLGLAALELGQSFSRSRPLLERARPYLGSLRDATRETTHLGTLHGFEVLHLDGMTTDRLVATSLRVGRRLPVHCTALGKVLVGCCAKRQRDAYDRLILDGGLDRRTERTIVDSDKFIEHLGMVAVQGFATDLGECEDGLGCVAAPVQAESGHVVAAISVSAPTSRASDDQLLREVAPVVVESAERLSRELGYRPVAT